jgi:hypothetical protein
VDQVGAVVPLTGLFMSRVGNTIIYTSTWWQEKQHDEPWRKQKLYMCKKQNWLGEVLVIELITENEHLTSYKKR